MIIWQAVTLTDMGEGVGSLFSTASIKHFIYTKNQINESLSNLNMPVYLLKSLAGHSLASEEKPT